MELLIGPLRTLTRAADEVEIVERKGIGHPDTICDALAEQLSVALCHYYLEHFGLVLHHNVDKVLLWGGVSRAAFGAGEMVEPMELFLAGRASLTFKGVTVPVAEIAETACNNWFRQHFHALDPEAHVKIHPLIRPGSPELVDLFMQQRKSGVWLANDTSCGVGFAPLSELERMTLSIEDTLNSGAMKRAHPQLGQDVKVMSVRRGERTTITVACAVIGKYVESLDAYLESKKLVASIVEDAAHRLIGDRVTVAVNTADDPDSGNVYLTVTGTSAESGDDGQAGRGNRANGLITPFRPMTLEAVAGKNPMTHVGKLYNVLAGRIAEALVEELPEITQAQCALVSRIGQPIDKPQMVDVRVSTEGDYPVEALTSEIRGCIETQLGTITTLWKPIVGQAVTLY